ncbi:hypothetical protein JG688_00007388 [Phytophthora aleatoria]|uniref:Uncharacterized protein n=1 Tax=Phytophthora aleatoria TaxID=2496075 RepID=A0A8J5MGG4_9STRA|nr:hypothetical protein JG688_00007388 [Phytophthora aleatoria]
MAEHPIGQELRRCPTGLLRIAAQNGHLPVLEYLFQQGWTDEDATCTLTSAARGNGQLEILKWLRANRYDGCSTKAMEDAARNGHLEELKWLHANTTAGCTTRAMDAAAYYGHLEVCKWLHANRSEGCSADAVQFAIGNGHLRLAFWLSKHYPQYVPDYNRMWQYPSNTLDMLLFLQVNYSSLFSLEFGRGTRSDLTYENNGNDSLIAQWLLQNYPGHPTESRDFFIWPVI